MIMIRYLTKEIRMKKGISIRELAELTDGISKSQISDVENNKKHPTVPVLHEIANALGVPFENTYEILSAIKDTF